MKLISTLLVVALAIDSSVVKAEDTDNYEANGSNFPFERAAGSANNYVPAGSAAYNNPNAGQAPPIAKMKQPLPPYMQQQQQLNQYLSGNQFQVNPSGNQFPGQAINYPGGNPTPSPIGQGYDNKDQRYVGQSAGAAAPLGQIQTALNSLEVVRLALLGMAGQGSYQNCFDDGCDLTRWKKCTCISPASYDNEGRGNCNLGATKLDAKVWCYIDPRNGDARTLCPDAQPSPSKPGFFWSRFACIT